MKRSRSASFATLGSLLVLFATCGGGSSDGGAGSGGKGSGGSAGQSTVSGGSGGAGGAGGGAGSKGTGGSASGGSGAGGKAGSGGSAGGAGGSSACTNSSNVSPCGGDVVGTWNVISSCMKWSGNLDLGSLGLVCPTAPVTGSLEVTGSWIGKADGKYTDNTKTTGELQIALPASCLELSGTTTTCERIAGVVVSLGYESVDCKAAAAGGCTCKAVVNQTSGAGLPLVEPPVSGTYKLANNQLSTDNDTQYDYCVSGNAMTWTPKTTLATVTGTVVFQNSAGGSGGSGGGTVASGGGPGSGGRTGQGGAAGGSGGGRDGGPDAPVGSGGAGGMGTGGGTGSGGATTLGDGPCDLYAAGNTPCVAAYSMVRVLSKAYTGPMYQVRKGAGTKNTGTGGTTKDIGSKDGFADSSAQDDFCGTETCTVSLIYDQSGKKNDLKVSKKGCYTGTASEDDYETSATKRTLNIGGHKVYGLAMSTHEGYRNNDSTTMPVNGTAQGIYEVADGKKATGYCCWDFGTASKDNCYTGGTGSMNALFFGGYIAWGKGSGTGPWFMADFEAGIWSGSAGSAGDVNNNNPTLAVDYAFGTMKTSASGWALKMGNAQSGSLTTAWDGKLPSALKTWSVKGGIILGTGGDNSNSGAGTFFEGAILSGTPTSDSDDAVYKNVQAAKYGQ